MKGELNMANSKIIFGGEVLIDLTADTVTEDKVLSGVTFHDKKGDTLEGTCSYDSDTSDDTAAVAEILAGKTAHARGSALTGTMPNNGAASGTIATKDGEYTIAQGYHDGSGKVAISQQERAKLIGGNIREGITILGVTGTMSGTEDVTAQSASVVPGTSQQVVTPGEGYNYLSQVTVAAIPYTETPNAAGGTTVKIG